MKVWFYEGTHFLVDRVATGILTVRWRGGPTAQPSDVEAYVQAEPPDVGTLRHYAAFLHGNDIRHWRETADEAVDAACQLILQELDISSRPPQFSQQEAQTRLDAFYQDLEDDLPERQLS